MPSGDGAGITTRKGDGDEYEDIGDNQSSTLDEQMLENRRTWKIAVESGAMLYNEEDDIMAALQAQNEENAQKRRLTKQKAKARRC
ncbi:hypothetical protein AHAS_Ahas19G0241400 [Arachis hypogaea]